MKESENTPSKIEYTKLCKTVRKKITEDIRTFSYNVVKKTLENNRGIEKTRRRLTIGKKSNSIK